MTVIITGLWGKHVERFTGDFSESLRQHAPEIPVFLFIGGYHIPPCQAAKIFPMSTTNGWEAFMRRHADNPSAQGRPPAARLKPKDRVSGYSFRFDAAKFAGQAFVPETASEALPDGELMIWLDADVITLKDIPKGFFEGLVG
ncbi:MAG TPA: hypothetical protein VIJ94_06025, partial [Caulobacteraceae bacterium]